MQTSDKAGQKQSRRDIRLMVESMDLMDLRPINLVVGRNYHTTWQTAKGMRFILKQLSGSKALLGTMYNSKTYWVDVDQLRNTRNNHVDELWNLKTTNI